jgi:hypothetical protein
VTSNLTPEQVISTLSVIGKDIDEATAEISRLDEAAVRARVAYKVAYAEAFLRTEGSMDIRKYSADLATQDVFLSHELADQEHRAALTQIRALRDRLEVGRSISVLVRLEWGQA